MSQQEEIQLFWDKITESIDRVLACLDEAPAERWNWKPAESANSLYVLAAHVVGSTEEHFIEYVFEEPVNRDRPGEFASQEADASPLYARWVKVRAAIEDKLAALPDGALDHYHDNQRLGRITLRELFITVAQHVAEHKGHAELTLQILLDE